jgi:hypothetical protein
MDSEKDIRELGIGDLGPFDTISVQCLCGRSVQYLPQSVKRRAWPKKAIIRELKFRCTVCNRRSGFRITIFDERGRGDNTRRNERVIVPG